MSPFTYRPREPGGRKNGEPDPQEDGRKPKGKRVARRIRREEMKRLILDRDLNGLRVTLTLKNGRQVSGVIRLVPMKGETNKFRDSVFIGDEDIDTGDIVDIEEF